MSYADVKNIEQIDFDDGTKLTSIFLGSYASREEAQPLIDAFENCTTFMNFEIIACPAGGSFAVFAKTYYDDEPNAIWGMLTSVLAWTVIEAGRDKNNG